MTHTDCSTCSALAAFPAMPCPDCTAFEAEFSFRQHERLIEALLRLGMLTVLIAVIGLCVFLAVTGIPVSKINLITVR